MKKTFLLLLWAGAIIAQDINPNNNNDDNMKKYWFLRAKLTNDFTLGVLAELLHVF